MSYGAARQKFTHLVRSGKADILSSYPFFSISCLNCCLICFEHSLHITYCSSSTPSGDSHLTSQNGQIITKFNPLYLGCPHRCYLNLADPGYRYPTFNGPRLYSRPAPGPLRHREIWIIAGAQAQNILALKIKVVKPSFSRPFMMYFTKKYFEFLSKLSRATTPTIKECTYYRNLFFRS
jgi:hypothetical protein